MNGDGGLDVGVILVGVLLGCRARARFAATHCAEGGLGAVIGRDRLGRTLTDPSPALAASATVSRTEKEAVAEVALGPPRGVRNAG